MVMFSPEDLRIVMQMLRKLHDQKIQSPWTFDLITSAEKLIKIMDAQDSGIFDPYRALHKDMVKINEWIEHEGIARVLCHNDTWIWNFLRGKDGSVDLIDWEYAGNVYAATDVANFAMSLDFDDEAYENLIEIYQGRAPTENEKRFYYGNMALDCWYWFVWAVYKEFTGVTVDDREMWYRKAVHAMEVAQKMYGIDS